MIQCVNDIYFFMRIRWTILQYGFKHAFFGANKIWLRLKFYFPDEKLCLIVHRCSYFLKCLLLITIAQGRFHKLSAIWNSIIIFEIKIIGPGSDERNSCVSGSLAEKKVDRSDFFLSKHYFGGEIEQSLSECIIIHLDT